jgi:hypothetical protein
MPGGWRRKGRRKERRRRGREARGKGRTYRRRGSNHVNPKDLQRGEWVNGELVGVAEREAEEEDNDFGDVP